MNKNLKILIVSDFFPPMFSAGAENIAYSQAREFKKRGYNVFVFTSTRDRKKIGWTKYEDIDIYYFWSDYNSRWRAYFSLFNFQLIFSFKKEIKKIRPDIVHFHNIHYYFSYHCIYLAKKNAKKVFLTAHDVMMFSYGKLHLDRFNKLNYKTSAILQFIKYKKRYNPLRNIIIKYYASYLNKIFAVSEPLKKALKINGFNNVITINNGIDVSTWKANNFTVDKIVTEYNLHNKKVILFAGRVSDAKGGQEILNAMVHVVKKIPNSILIILGENKKYIESMFLSAKKNNIDKNIMSLGWIDNSKLKNIYNLSRLVVVPSICFDSFPTINLEAFSCKKPVIATCFGGSKDIVKNSYNGYIVNPKNIHFMAKKIIDLLENPKKAKLFGERGYFLVCERFSLKRNVDTTLKEYMK